MSSIIKIVTTLVVQLAVGEVDGKQYNHLLETDTRGPDREYRISFTANEPLQINYGKWYKMRFEMECREAYTLKPVPQALENNYPWGIPGRQYLCDADQVTILGEVR